MALVLWVLRRCWDCRPHAAGRRTALAAQLGTVAGSCSGEASRQLARPARNPFPHPPAVIDKAVVKGILHKSTAARRKARLAVARQNVLIQAGLYKPAQ